MFAQRQIIEGRTFAVIFSCQGTFEFSLQLRMNSNVSERNNQVSTYI